MAIDTKVDRAVGVPAEASRSGAGFSDEGASESGNFAAGSYATADAEGSPIRKRTTT
jgi:hypothetical protein